MKHRVSAAACLGALGAVLRRFVVIYGFTMLTTLLFLLLFSRGVQLDYRWFLWCVLFSAAAELPMLVFHSRRELSEAQWRRRFALNLFLTELVLMPLGYLGQMWRGFGGAALFFFAILAVSFGVRAVFFGAHLREAEQLNTRLMQKRSADSAR